MKLHYPLAQLDIQSFTMSGANEGNLNDVWMVISFIIPLL
jgi:hypothetical protein